MLNLVVAFDIDYTLYDPSNQTWNGSKELWNALCQRLIEYGRQNKVNIQFAIVSARSNINSVVIEILNTLSDYLYAASDDNHQQTYIPIIRHSTDKNGVICDICFAGENKYYYDGKFYPSDNQSSIHLTHLQPKSLALSKLAAMFHIDDYSKIFLVDDKLKNREDAAASGFSTINSESINAGENTGQQRVKETKKLTAQIFNSINYTVTKAKVRELVKLLLNNDANAILAFMKQHRNIHEIFALFEKKIATPPLYIAAVSCPDAIPILLQFGANAKQNINGKTPLSILLSDQQTINVENVLRLIESGADVKTMYGKQTILEYLITKHPEFIPRLVKSGAMPAGAIPDEATNMKRKIAFESTKTRHLSLENLPRFSIYHRPQATQSGEHSEAHTSTESSIESPKFIN